ncbi:MAG: hypothetical protein RLY86_450 [Pseudomonadota bacterium]|jgi:dipeptide transport system substrate-binding protein
MHSLFLQAVLAATVLPAVLTGILSAPPAQAKTLVYCAEGSPENFNPQINTTGTSFDANLPIYNRLVEFAPGTIDIVPGLAERWEVSEDGLAWTFHLRAGVAWHSNWGFTPTRPLTAADVVFSLERQWKADHPFHTQSGGGYDYFNDMGFGTLLAGVEAVDDRTVVFRLTRPDAAFLANMAMDFASILSAEYADHLLRTGRPERMDQDPIGTGPFRMVRYQKDAQIRYQAFDAHWGGAPALRALVFAITPDAAVRMAKLRQGECHVAPFPNPADLPALKSDPELTVLSQEGLNIGYLALNTGKPPFDDVRVRRAVAMAIDRQAILDAVYQGTGSLATNPIPPILWGSVPDLKNSPHDPAAAKALLAEAGFPDGFETDLWAMPVQRPYNPDARRIAEMMQADLAAVGIRARIVSYEWGEYRKRAQAGEHSMVQFGWTGDNGDPDNFLTLLGCDGARPGGSNLAKWCHPEFESRLQAARRITDRDKRAALYREAIHVFKQEVPWVTIAHSVVHMPIRNEVVGYRVSPLGRHQFDGVGLAE